MQNIQCGSYTFKTMREPAPRWSEVPNTIWRKTASGSKERAVKYGASVKRISYQLWLENGNSPDDITNFEAFVAGLSDLSTTFTLVDHKGASCTARVLGYERTQDEDDELVEIELLQVLT